MINPVAALLADPGVLATQPCIAWHDVTAVERCGGFAVLPWRATWLAAHAAGLEAGAQAPAEADFTQAVVHARKERAGTWADCAAAWRCLRLGGRLLLCGDNEIGIAGSAKRLGRELNQDGQVLANRRRARVVAFVKDAGPGPQLAAPAPVERAGWTYTTAPGVFAAGSADAGSELLLRHCAALPTPERILDLGAGSGLLAVSLLRLWPQARAVLAEADALALACADSNAHAAGCAERATCVWWDAVSEPSPAQDCDLVVCNPPWHQGKAVDFAPAEGMFAALDAALRPGGRALVVANTRLPYERQLAALGALEILATEPGFKLLRLTR
ncbi:MAG: methyltransferase [Planctomycetota bacterium]|nr:methyltransferase [Planctomycetota bacterium]